MVTPYHFSSEDVLGLYSEWPRPKVIISDGAYGLGGFWGDPHTVEELPEWYQPHLDWWAKKALPSTALWFWNSELGFATMHPHILKAGFDYVESVVWDKGLAHVAGNVNSKTIRRFPVASEVCVLYEKRLSFPDSRRPGEALGAKQWLRSEWLRAGLPLQMANLACGVKNAATRKYLTQDRLWYFPPAEIFAMLADFANQKGHPEGRPYFSLDGKSPITEDEWGEMRRTWNHLHGFTNVWREPPVTGEERMRGNFLRSAPRTHNPGQASAVCLSQKPLRLMEMLIGSSSQAGDVVWEPFGGLCSGSVAALKLDRTPYCAEQDWRMAPLALERLRGAAGETSPDVL